MEFTTRDAMRPSFFRVEDLSTHWTMAGNARHGERKRTGDKRKQTKSSSKRNYNNIGAGGPWHAAVRSLIVPNSAGALRIRALRTSKLTAQYVVGVTSKSSTDI